MDWTGWNVPDVLYGMDGLEVGVMSGRDRQVVSTASEVLACRSSRALVCGWHEHGRRTVDGGPCSWAVGGKFVHRRVWMAA